MNEKSTFETLGDRMKHYEDQFETSIPFDEKIVIRVDGHKFSKYTKGFKRPFDAILSKAMEETTKDLLKEFNAVVGYTQSDEITLVIKSLEPLKKHYNKKPKQDQQKHTYSGRIQKLASLTAGFATMAFNKHLEALIKDYLDEYDVLVNMREDLLKEDEYNYFRTLPKKIGKAWFDARVYSAPNDIEAFNSVLWRVRDAEKNSRSMFAQEYCSHKSLQKMNGQEQIDFCKATTGEDWELIDDRYKYGILVKKEKYLKKLALNDYNYTPPAIRMDDGSSGIERTRIISYSEHLVFSDDNVAMLMNKYRIENVIDLEKDI